MRERIDAMLARMRQSPVLSGESYPMECWMFCNTVALAALKIADALDGSDHSALFGAWLAAAKRRLVDPGTGILNSSFARKPTVTTTSSPITRSSTRPDSTAR